MSHTIIIIFFVCLLGLGGAMRLRHDQAAKAAARQRAKETVEAYPWDWTREDERKVGAAMELICDKCHEPFRCSAQDELDEACELCPVADMLYRLVAEGRKKSFDCAQDDRTYPPAPLGQPPLGKGAKVREEARG